MTIRAYAVAGIYGPSSSAVSIDSAGAVTITPATGQTVTIATGSSGGLRVTGTVASVFNGPIQVSGTPANIGPSTTNSTFLANFTTASSSSFAFGITANGVAAWSIQYNGASGDVIHNIGGTQSFQCNATTGYVQVASRLGIGVTPSYALDVSGTGHISTILSVNTTAQVAYLNADTANTGNSAAIFRQTVASATVPVLIVTGGATPGAGGRLQEWRDSGNTPYAFIAGNSTNDNQLLYVESPQAALNAARFVSAGSATAATVFVKMSATPGAGGHGLRITKSDGTTDVFVVTNLYSAVMGSAALATTATDGFLYITTSAGAPTGVPTAFTGRIPIHYDTTNNFLYFYNGGWKKSTVYA